MGPVSGRRPVGVGGLGPRPHLDLPAALGVAHAPDPAVGADGVVRPDHAVGQDGVVADDLGAGRRTTDVPGTAALLVDDAGRHLPHPHDAHKPTRCPGHWAFPGGSAEPGEACDQAVAREPREETGPVVPHRRTVRARAEHVFAHVKT
ncbi:NUDIX domain-containing protein [Streptomyces kebangsaanensis]|uniref:NUDIX domain-containing protein n=1 Tax=Streptomyces kebangsaanensis TaxID=864058 RepID=A0ABW6L2N8_9ACTN